MAMKQLMQPLGQLMQPPGGHLHHGAASARQSPRGPLGKGARHTWVLVPSLDHQLAEPNSYRGLRRPVWMGNLRLRSRSLLPFFGQRLPLSLGQLMQPLGQLMQPLDQLMPEQGPGRHLHRGAASTVVRNPTNGKSSCLCTGSRTGKLLGNVEVGNVVLAQEMLDQTFPIAHRPARVRGPTFATFWTALHLTKLLSWEDARIALEAIIIVPDQMVENSSTLDQPFAMNSSPHHGMILPTAGGDILGNIWQR